MFDRHSLKFLLLNFKDYYIIVVMLLLTYLSIFLDGKYPAELDQTLLLLGLGAVYLVVAVTGSEYIQRTHSIPATFLLFIITISVATSIGPLSNFTGAFWLLMMPLVTNAMVLLPRLWAVFTCVVILGCMVLPITIMTTRWNTAITNAFAFGAAIVFVAVFSELVLRERKNRTEVERLASELSEANRKLREYAMQAEELAVTRERNRLAREIHDTLGHYLTTVNMQLEAARALLDTDRNKAEAAMLKAQNLTREGLLEVRHSVASLRSLPVEGRTLREAIGALVGENATTGIITELVVTGEERLLGPQYELALYRAAQEALTNVRKHSLATQADVCLEYRQNSVKLSVKDNGTGASNNGNGFGLMGLRERVHLLGGDVSTITAPGEGFLLEVELRI